MLIAFACDSREASLPAAAASCRPNRTKLQYKVSRVYNAFRWGCNLLCVASTLAFAKKKKLEIYICIYTFICFPSKSVSLYLISGPVVSLCYPCSFVCAYVSVGPSMFKVTLTHTYIYTSSSGNHVCYLGYRHYCYIPFFVGIKPN